MFRTGIYTIKQLTTKNLVDIFGKSKNISLKVYSELDQLLDTELKEYYAEIILNRFNSNNNIIKRTYRDRFNSFDDTLISEIKNQNFPDLRIHDLAISDGRASCYFIENILKQFPKATYNGSDISISYDIYNTDEKDIYLITDDKSNIIEITKPPFVWNYQRPEGIFYFLNNWLKQSNKRKYTNYIQSQKTPSGNIFIIDSKFKMLLDKNDEFSIFNYDLFERSNKQYNVIRAMNILHSGYFDQPQLKLILGNIHSSLATGGIFAEGSNENAGSEVEGAIYKKTNTGFEMLKSAEKSSRIIKEVLEFTI